ncbi:hypothetical protein Ccrd_021180 [Cynara cardunculus var. scolymus]|uniref:Uncharacterized protein n=1 Tax=Cynara cardunculus var. scolymus TaxID=59895 RepID=A0A103Y138_CYNCS|nr:hypothetical protein Ccrd_021180 [Cynara cardunculus var. scolymus]
MGVEIEGYKHTLEMEPDIVCWERIYLDELLRWIDYGDGSVIEAIGDGRVGCLGDMAKGCWGAVSVTTSSCRGMEGIGESTVAHQL